MRKRPDDSPSNEGKRPAPEGRRPLFGAAARRENVGDHPGVTPAPAPAQPAPTERPENAAPWRANARVVQPLPICPKCGFAACDAGVNQSPCLSCGDVDFGRRPLRRRQAEGRGGAARASAGGAALRFQIAKVMAAPPLLRFDLCVPPEEPRWRRAYLFIGARDGSKQMIPMRRIAGGAGGACWRVELPLAPREYSYRFYLENAGRLVVFDPRPPGQWPDGSIDLLLRVGAPDSIVQGGVGD